MLMSTKEIFKMQSLGQKNAPIFWSNFLLIMELSRSSYDEWTFRITKWPTSLMSTHGS